MRKTITLLTFLFIAAQAFAQNWDPIKPATRNYFTNVHGYLKAMEVDSVIGYGADLHYYPYLRHHFDAGGIWVGNNGPDTIGCWLGRNVIKKANGDFLFINHWSDTTLIRTRASVGQSWIFNQHGNKYYTAEVTSIDTMTVLGSLDSIKRIQLHAYSGNIMLTADSFHNAEIILSKDHGFYTTMELYYFPFHYPDTSLVVNDYYFQRSLVPYTDYFSTFTPVGKYNCTFRLTDFHNPPPTQFVDWNVGDIFQYDACFISVVMGSTTCQPPYNYMLDTIIAKNVTSAGVEYVRKGWKAMAVLFSNSSIISHYYLWPFQDTVFFSNSGTYFNVENDTMSVNVPEKAEPMQNWMPGWYHHYFPNDTACGVVSPAYYKRSFYFAGLNAGMQFYAHKQGLGHTTDISMAYDNITMNGHNSLIYSVRNGIPCGNYIFPDTSAPVSVTALSNDAFKIFPNPANEHLRIETSASSYDLTLLNSIGQVILSRNNNSTKQDLDLKNYPEGIYILRISTTTGHRSDHKIVIQH